MRTTFRKRVLEQIQRKVDGGDHRGADRGAEDADHRPHGGSQGELAKGKGTAGERKPAQRTESKTKVSSSPSVRSAGVADGRQLRADGSREGLHLAGRRQAAGAIHRAGPRVRARRVSHAQPRPARRAAVLLPGSRDSPDGEGPGRGAHRHAPHPRALKRLRAQLPRGRSLAELHIAPKATGSS